MSRPFLIVFVAVSLAGCAVRAPYVAPAPEPATFASADPSLVGPDAFDPRWWAQFEDPVLDGAIVRALEANPDVRVALARVDQARAFTDEVNRDRYPTVTVGAAAERRDQVIPGFTEGPRGISTYRAGFDAFWELMLAPWDVAAGILLVREAGGKVTDLAGNDSVAAHAPIVSGPWERWGCG